MLEVSQQHFPFDDETIERIVWHAKLLIDQCWSANTFIFITGHLDNILDAQHSVYDQAFCFCFLFFMLSLKGPVPPPPLYYFDNSNLAHNPQFADCFLMPSNTMKRTNALTIIKSTVVSAISEGYFSTDKRLVTSVIRKKNT